MHNKTIIISVEGGKKGGGAGTLANELSYINDLNVKIFRDITHTKIDYIINVLMIFTTIIKIRKSTNIILFDAMSTFLLGMICYIIRRKYSVCLHGSEVEEFITKPSRIKTLFLSKYLYAFILRQAKFVIVPSEAQKQKILGYVLRSKIRVFPWGANVNVELDAFFSANFKARVVVVSRISNGKNIIELLNECEKSMSPDIGLAVVGGGPLESEAAAICKASANLYFCGKLSNNAVQNIIANADAVLAPSGLAESYGLSLRDAIMLDKTCIANNVGAHAEFAHYRQVEICFGVEDMVKKINSTQASTIINADQLDLMHQRKELLEFLIRT